MADEFDNLEDGLQEPEQAGKEKKGGNKMMMYIGIGVGALILNVAIIIVLVKFVFNSSGEEGHDKKSKIANVKHGEESEDGGGHGDEDAEKEFFATEKERKFLELGRITTNPKNSGKFIVISVGCVYREKAHLSEEDAKPDSEYMRKLIAKVKSTIINEIGQMSVEEIQAKRPNLEIIFRDKLRPIFKEKQIFLREIILNEFILQG